jgi:ParB family chromosome partitioning protein
MNKRLVPARRDPSRRGRAGGGRSPTTSTRSRAARTGAVDARRRERGPRRRAILQQNGSRRGARRILVTVTSLNALPEVRSVPIDSIRIPAPRLRSLGDVDALRESIAMGGLLQPIVLDASLTLVCGMHRLEACRQLGWTEIPAVIERVDGAQAELAEIDENLCRRELSALERAEHIAKRKRIWLALEADRLSKAPADESDKKKKSKKSEKPREPELTAFVDDTARMTGKAKRAVREELKIGEMPAEVRDTIRDTPISYNKRELLALTKMQEPEALEAAVAVKSGEATSVRKKAPKKEDKKSLERVAHRDEIALGLEADARATGEREVGADGFDAWAGPDRSLVRERQRHAIVDAVEAALAALEKAESLWPSDEEGGAEGGAKLREALAAVTRVRRWLDDADESRLWAAAS